MSGGYIAYRRNIIAPNYVLFYADKSSEKEASTKLEAYLMNKPENVAIGRFHHESDEPTIEPLYILPYRARSLNDKRIHQKKWENHFYEVVLPYCVENMNLHSIYVIYRVERQVEKTKDNITSMKHYFHLLGTVPFENLNMEQADADTKAFYNAQLLYNNARRLNPMHQDSIALGRIVMDENDAYINCIPWVIAPSMESNIPEKDWWKVGLNSHIKEIIAFKAPDPNPYRVIQIENPNPEDSMTILHKNSPSIAPSYLFGGKQKTTHARLETLTVKELQARCAKRKLAYSGLRKAELVALLRR